MSENDQIKVLVFLKKQLEEEMRKSKQLEEKVSRLSLENDNFSRKLGAQEKDSEKLLSEKEFYLNHIEELNAQVDKIQREKLDLESFIEDLKRERKLEMEKYEEANSNLVEKLNEIADLKDASQESLYKFEILEKEAVALKEESAKLRDENGALIAENQKLKKFVDHVSLLASQKTMEIARLDKLLKSQNPNMNNNYNQEIEQYKEKLSAVIQEKEELELNLSEMKNILNTNESEVVSAFLQKVSKLSDLQEIHEICNSEHSIDDLVEKFSTLLKVKESTAGLKENEMKLSLSNFQPNNIVLFMKDSRGNWEIFNRNCAGYYLSMDAVNELKKKEGYKDLLSVVAKILYIEEEVSQKNNDYGFIPGQKFHRVYIYPFEK